ncbi:MAG: TonB family protein [Acidobacteria bacterium]|nr:TonB family protein [Acidobacteriota bacterium]
MPRELFGDVVHSSMTIGNRKWYTLPLSVIVHALLITVVIIVPVLVADVLPAMPVMLAFGSAPRPPGPPPAPPPVQRAAARAAPAANPDAAPVNAPSGIKPDDGIVRDPEPADPSGVEGGVPGSVPGSIVAGLNEPPPPPMPVAPIRVFSGIRPPTRIKDVRPVYPDLAQKARVSGTVIIEAVIGPDGKVTDARVLRSIPLLDRAALDAVSQWLYTPTLLSGMPVSVVMTVTVTFTLQ